MIMTVYCGRNFATGIEREVRAVAPGVGEIDCMECEGTGWWAFMEPEIPGEPCVQCKGTGRQLISI